MATAKKEAKKVSVEYGPFGHRLKAHELAKKGDSTVVQKDGAYFVRSAEMPEKDAKIMCKSLAQAGYTAAIV